MQVVASRLQSSALHRPFLVRTGLSVVPASQPAQLYISLRPTAWPGAPHA